MIIELVVKREDVERFDDTILDLLDDHQIEDGNAPPIPSAAPYKDCMSYILAAEANQIDDFANDLKELEIPFDIKMESGITFLQNTDQAYRPEYGELVSLTDARPLESDPDSIMLEYDKQVHQPSVIPIPRHETKRQWEFSFDLSTKELKKVFGEKSYANAYTKLRRSLESNDFDDKSEKQGSCYFTSAMLTEKEARESIEQVCVENPWLETCLKRSTLAVKRDNIINIPDYLKGLKAGDPNRRKKNEKTSTFSR